MAIMLVLSDCGFGCDILGDDVEAEPFEDDLTLMGELSPAGVLIRCDGFLMTGGAGLRAIEDDIWELIE